MQAAFWRDRRVFLTGHTGFKGSWLSLWLNAMGSRVTGYALAPDTRPSLFVEARVGQLVESIEADVRDAARLRAALVAAQPEVVIHMAAQALVRESYRRPVDTYATNVMGTVHLLEAVREIDSVRSVVIVTTDKCFDNPEDARPFCEEDPLGGRDPYSSSKACAELVTTAYRASFFRDPGCRAAIASARAGNVIGGGDWATDRLIPDLIRAFEAGRPAQLRNPGAVRPWQHVLEPLRGYLVLAERLATHGAPFGQAYNFGPKMDEVKPVAWVADQLAARFGQPASWQHDGGQQPHEAQHLQLAISRAREQLGWVPRLSLADSLDLTIDWARARQAGADVRAITLSQIAAYQAHTEVTLGQ